MAIQSSGIIRISDLVTEFGGTAPHSLSEYYRGGLLVPNSTINGNIPTGGQINLSNFYGAQKRVPTRLKVLSGLSVNTATVTLSQLDWSVNTHLVVIATKFDYADNLGGATLTMSAGTNLTQVAAAYKKDSSDSHGSHIWTVKVGNTNPTVNVSVNKGYSFSVFQVDGNMTQMTSPYYSHNTNNNFTVTVPQYGVAFGCAVRHDSNNITMTGLDDFKYTAASSQHGAAVTNGGSVTYNVNTSIVRCYAIFDLTV
jgi:hypothetical protein